MLEVYFSYPFRLFFAPFCYYFLLITRYYAENNNKNPSKNNSKSIHEKIPDSYLKFSKFKSVILTSQRQR
jgi:hypothetical protein